MPVLSSKPVYKEKGRRDKGPSDIIGTNITLYKSEDGYPGRNIVHFHDRAVFSLDAPLKIYFTLGWK